MRRINDWLMGLPPVQRAGVVLGFFGVSLGGGFAGYFRNWPLLITIGAGVVLVVLAILLWKLLTKKTDKDLTSGLEAWGKQAPRGNEKQIADTLQLQGVFSEGLVQIRDALRANKKDLYHIPWYLVVGPPGSGKTEMIRRSGISFFVDNMNKGTGGTLSMDWWPSEGGILVDSAGRLFTDGGDEWRALLQLLRKSRPRCPVNGVVLAIGADGLLRGSEEELARTLLPTSKRLAEIQKELQVRLPVYVIITKCDLVPGFKEFFDHVEGPEQQAQMLGWADEVPLEQEHRFRPDQIDTLLARMVERIRKRRWALLQDLGRGEPPPGTPRVNYMDTLYELPETLERQVMPRLKRYLEVIFGQSQGVLANRPAFVRGVYFTSAMQEGGSLDAFMAQTMGVPVEKVPADGRRWEKDRSVFIRGVFLRKVFPEKGLVTPALDVGREVVRRQLFLFGSVAAGILLLGGLMLWAGFTLRDSVNGPASEWRELTDKYNSAKNSKATILTQREEVTTLLKDSTIAAKNPLGLTFPFSVFSRDMASDERRHAHREMVDTLAFQPLVEAACGQLTDQAKWPIGAQDSEPFVQSAALLCSMTNSDKKGTKDDAVVVTPPAAAMYAVASGEKLSEADAKALTDAFELAYEGVGTSAWNVWPPKFAGKSNAGEGDAKAVVDAWSTSRTNALNDLIKRGGTFAQTHMPQFAAEEKRSNDALKDLGDAKSVEKFTELERDYRSKFDALKREWEGLTNFLSLLKVQAGQAPGERLKEEMARRREQLKAESNALLAALPAGDAHPEANRIKEKHQTLIESATKSEAALVNAMNLDAAKTVLDKDIASSTWKFEAVFQAHDFVRQQLDDLKPVDPERSPFGESLASAVKALGDSRTTYDDAKTKSQRDTRATKTEVANALEALHKHRCEMLRDAGVRWLLNSPDSAEDDAIEALSQLVFDHPRDEKLVQNAADASRNQSGSDLGVKQSEPNWSFNPDGAAKLSEFVEALKAMPAFSPESESIARAVEARDEYFKKFRESWRAYAEPTLKPANSSTLEDRWNHVKAVFESRSLENVKAGAKSRYEVLTMVGNKCKNDSILSEFAKLDQWTRAAASPEQEIPLQRALKFLTKASEEGDLEAARGFVYKDLNSDEPTGRDIFLVTTSKDVPAFLKDAVKEALACLAEQSDKHFQGLISSVKNLAGECTADLPLSPEKAAELVKACELAEKQLKSQLRGDATEDERKIRGRNYVSTEWLTWCGSVKEGASTLTRLKDAVWLVNLPKPDPTKLSLPDGEFVANQDTDYRWQFARLFVDEKSKVGQFTIWQPASSPFEVSTWGRSVALTMLDSVNNTTDQEVAPLGDASGWSILPQLLRAKKSDRVRVGDGGWAVFPVSFTDTKGTRCAVFLSVKPGGEFTTIDNILKLLPFQSAPAPK